jgi:hypothetical protein
MAHYYNAILIDKHGGFWGPFETLASLVAFATREWPDQAQDQDRTGKGWDIVLLRSPIGVGPDEFKEDIITTTPSASTSNQAD